MLASVEEPPPRVAMPLELTKPPEGVVKGSLELVAEVRGPDSDA